MVASAAAQFSINRAGLVNWLQHHPQRITELTEFAPMARELVAMRMPLLAADDTDLLEGIALSQSHGLLTNDALALAILQRHRIEHLATNDDDFDIVPHLKVWKPR
jgi:predicted nucleic acid-binding protein